ncbi:MAG: S8 family peptidase [Microscillaceae bacterium]|nr:S8 family peptidase [Microscillaceae bacterium]MDW8459939.1 S8 family peptidase [Cytophagales bacterium]
MKQYIKSILLAFILCLTVYSRLSAQEKPPANWFNLDEQQDGIRGVSTERAYRELLKDKQPKRVVIVGVIDSGVDIQHEDLQTKLWKNTKEKAGNKKDDDKNGYIDDIDGWNFIGGKDGRNIKQDNLEVTREYVRLSKLYKDKKESDFSGKKLEEYKYYLKVKEDFESKLKEAKQNLFGFKFFYMEYTSNVKILKKYLNKPETAFLTEQEVKAIGDSVSSEIKEARNQFLNVAQLGLDEEGMKEYMEYLENKVKYSYNPDFDPRKEIVGDDYDNLKEKGYGNNDVIGTDAKHGTHVAGIIASNRDNEIGIKGVANSVLIMPIRAVPDGDERDKDIANAIRYAVDNGANIINMSFGKGYSPHKAIVDEAVKYAESKNVLLVHAAGNEALNLDESPNFPNRRYANSTQQAENWIEVGASSWGNEDNFVGSFSNYGKTTVDVFAPGVDIYSTIPNQKYKNESGTSMAAPVTSGVAALIMAYYPEFSAKEVKEIILKSAVRYPNKKINKPKEGEAKNKEYTTLDQLCITGGIVNAYEALKLAEQMSKNKKK